MAHMVPATPLIMPHSLATWAISTGATRATVLLRVLGAALRSALQSGGAQAAGVGSLAADHASGG
jgi:hypothetical protein